MSVPDYYGILGVAPNASAEQIKKAYQKESLRSHPDRFPNASPEEAREHTRRFQSVADAYYVLSDRTRRAEYDRARKSSPLDEAEGTEDAQQDSSANFFRRFWQGRNTQPQPQPERMFADVWEELLRPEVEQRMPIWQYAGMISGTVTGYIIGNIPGALGGGALGRYLGSVRDAKGKSVGEVFLRLRTDQRAEILKALATKVLGSL